MNNITKRLSMWAVVVALLLLIPLILTIRDGAVPGVGWNWSPFDFVFMGILLFGSALTYELVARKMNNVTYRVAVGLAVVTALLLVWINGAVGIIGDGEFDSPNGMYFGVLLVGIIGAFIARFKPRGMSRALFVMAFAQALVPVIALIISDPNTWGSRGVLGVFLLNGFFVLMFTFSGLLFRRVSVEPANI